MSELSFETNSVVVIRRQSQERVRIEVSDCREQRGAISSRNEQREAGQSQNLENSNKKNNKFGNSRL